MSESNSEIVWYIAREGQQHGPLSDAEMRLFVESGHLKPADLVWNPEMTEWKPATSVFPAPVAPPSPPPPPAPPQKPEATAAEAPQKEPVQEPKTTPAKSAQGSQPSPGNQPATTQASSPNATSGQQPTTADAGKKSGPTASSVPAPEDVLPSMRPQQGGSAGPAAHTAIQAGQPATVEDYGDDDDYDDAPRSGRAGMMVGAAAMVAVLAGGGYFAYQNKDAILAYMNVEASDGASAPPVVKAESGGTKTAALQKKASPPPTAPAAPAQPDSGPSGPPLQGITVTIPPTSPVESAPGSSDTSQASLDTIDTNLQKSQLWRVVKSEFPDWYQGRVKEIAQLSGSASETDLSKHLIGKLVALRRENAKFALTSSTDHLQKIASAFLNNLKSLAGHSTEACYTFISKGETSPSVISLFPKPGYGDAIEGQIAAVFRAVADGRKTPVQRAKATKPDYDVLAAELTKIGWSKADLGLFANPQALAKAPPERVCKMVQDWFSAHVAISDKTVQERLLVETLRPVVAG